MFGWLRARGEQRARAAALHDAVVAEARAPQLYANLGVPDTLDGRLEMLVLHMCLVLNRLQHAGDEGAALARGLTEAYVVAMDDTMRAIGVGDLAVPRKVKKAAAKLYDRNRIYAAASAASEADRPQRWADALRQAMSSLDAASTLDLDALTRYVVERQAQLDTLAWTSLQDGRLSS